MYKLRPHHLLCTQGYSGNGYSKDFVDNMNTVTSYLRNNLNSKIEIIFSTDDLCASCPNKIGTNLCKYNFKVQSYDEKIIKYFNIEEKIYNYNEIISAIYSKITPLILKDICSNCDWYPISRCRKNILQI